MNSSTQLIYIVIGIMLIGIVLNFMFSFRLTLLLVPVAIFAIYVLIQVKDDPEIGSDMDSEDESEEIV